MYVRYVRTVIAVRIVFMVKSESKQKRLIAVMHMAMMLMSPAWTCAQSNSKPLNVRIRFDIQFVFVLINLRIVDSSEIPDSSHPYSGVVYKKAIE